MSVARYFSVGTAARSDRISWNAPGDQVQGCVAARYRRSSSLEWWWRLVASARRRRNSELAAALGWASAKRVKLKYDTDPKVEYTQFRFIFPAHTLRHRFAFPDHRLLSSDTTRTLYVHFRAAAMSKFILDVPPFPPIHPNFIFGRRN